MLEINLVRIINEYRLASFRKDKNVQSWDDVLNTNEVNHAYVMFLHIFIHLFNKHCPVKTVLKKSCINKKPWFTDGLNVLVQRKRGCTKHLLYLNLLKRN